MVDLMCCFGFGVFVFCPSFVSPHELCLTGSLAGIAPCSFALPRLGFVINLFCILLSGRSAVGNMPVRCLKPHVLGELDLGSCFILSSFDILNWKATEISSFSLSLEFCVLFFRIFCSNHSGTLFSSVLAISMVPIWFFACLIILTLSAGAADTNSTGTVDASQNMSSGNLTAYQAKAVKPISCWYNGECLCLATMRCRRKCCNNNNR